MRSRFLFPLLFVTAVPFLSGWEQSGWFDSPGYFQPTRRLSGVGVERKSLTDDVIARRAQLMIESHSFGILREPRAVEGAERINSPRLQRLFREAEERTGWPATTLAAMAFLESWGIADAQSPAGPKGIMQIASGTARSMGLDIVHATRYRTVTERRMVPVKRGRKPVARTVRRRIPYTVLVRDERLMPELAVPAAAGYLARLAERYGGRDWAIFAYHCGEGCTAQFRGILDRSDNMKDRTVARAFFNNSPSHNRELFEAIQHHMERDWSPTYWFRIMRAEQLLALHRENPAAFRKLAAEYRNWMDPAQRAPHRLAVWLQPDDLSYQSCEELKMAQGSKLFRVLDDPKKYGFTLRTMGPKAIGSWDVANQEYYLQATSSAIGTLAYIAFETRRLHEAMKPKNERWMPIEVTALVRPREDAERLTRGSRLAVPAHCSGQVFDLSLENLPPGEREALEFVLSDMGWHGYLGFVRESPGSDTVHVGSAPSSRPFFEAVYAELAKR